jgi:hypothetical protein
MITADRREDIPRDAAFVIVRADGRFDVYFEGETPPFSREPGFAVLYRFQFIFALENRGLLDAFETAARAARSTRLWFENRQFFNRADPTLLQIAAAAGIDTLELDTVWREGAAITRGVNVVSV